MWAGKGGGERGVEAVLQHKGTSSELFIHPHTLFFTVGVTLQKNMKEELTPIPYKAIVAHEGQSAHRHAASLHNY